ncbi:MAG: MMPL family transporter [Planctomycetes bacterium]|nr:MMPL family transporter [Planctomycetota bacterium]
MNEPNPADDPSSRASRGWREATLAWGWTAVGRRPGLALLALGLLTALGLGLWGRNLRVDFSVEQAFPERDATRATYERYREAFPGGDRRALVLVEADDVFSPSGLRRLDALEGALGRVEGVERVEGPTSSSELRVVQAQGESALEVRPLFVPGLDAAGARAQRRTATEDPLYRWRLARPDGRAATLHLTLYAEALATDAQRSALVARLRAVLAEHRAAGQRLALGGFPVTRTHASAVLRKDALTLLPLAIGLALLVLGWSTRCVTSTAAALVTALAALCWTVLVTCVLGWPLLMLSVATPVVVLIVSLSDSVHVIGHAQHALRRGLSQAECVREAWADSAGPCLITEVVIAFGFLSLCVQDVAMISRLGALTAAGALCAWLANVTVLPALLRLAPMRAAPKAGGGRALSRGVLWLELLGRRHPRRVALGAGLVLSVMLLGALRVRSETYAHQALDSSLPRVSEALRVASGQGGSVPLVVWIEPPAAQVAADAMLEPTALALVDRVAGLVEATLHPNQVHSPTRILRRVHEAFADAGGLPPNAEAAAQELLLVPSEQLEGLFDRERSSATVAAVLPDTGVRAARPAIASLERALELEAQRTGYRISLTGTEVLLQRIHSQLVEGLALSLLLAALVSAVVFRLALGSWRLGLVALALNVLPLAATLGIMGWAGIALDPATVVVFSITLVIADDDTIQFCTRYRRTLALPGMHPDRALRRTVLRCGPAMVLTAACVGVGFALLGVSHVIPLQRLGLLAGTSLAVAAACDLLLGPPLLRWVARWR